MLKNNKDQTNVRFIILLVMCYFMMIGLREKVIRYGELKVDLDKVEIKWTNSNVNTYSVLIEKFESIFDKDDLYGRNKIMDFVFDLDREERAVDEVTSKEEEGTDNETVNEVAETKDPFMKEQFKNK